MDIKIDAMPSSTGTTLDYINLIRGYAKNPDDSGYSGIGLQIKKVSATSGANTVYNVGCFNDRSSVYEQSIASHSAGIDRAEKVV